MQDSQESDQKRPLTLAQSPHSLLRLSGSSPTIPIVVPLPPNLFQSSTKQAKGGILIDTCALLSDSRQQTSQRNGRVTTPSFGAKGALQVNFHQARALFLHFYLFLHVNESRGVSIFASA